MTTPNKTKSKYITAQDLYRFQLPTDCQISPDGNWVVYSLKRVDRKSEKKYTNLWVAPTSPGQPRQFTQGNHTDSSPRWSPDSQTIAFISGRDEENQSQIYLMPMQGGEAYKLSDLKGELGAFRWSPDGKKIVLQFRKTDAEELEREKDEDKKKLGVVARHIDRVFFKLDDEGYLPKERWHLWIIDAKTGKATQLTDHAIFDENFPAWSPDSKQIAFISNHAKDPDLDPDNFDLFTVAATGGTAKKMTTVPGPKFNPVYSPDGRWIAYAGADGKGTWWSNMRIFVVPVNGKEPARDLTGKFDVDASVETINDLPEGALTMPPVWSNDSQSLYFQISKHGNTHLAKISLDENAKLEPVIAGDGVVGVWTLDAAQEKLAYIWGDLYDPGQILVRKMETGRTRQLSKFNGWLHRLDLGSIEEKWIDGPGNNKLQGWILKPPGFTDRKKYPTILEIHGGPMAQYGHFFMHEFYLLAAAGYVVAFTNPRGSKGYGEAFCKAINGDWGGPDYEDVMAWTDFVAKQPFVDTKRMGVTGGSYGGYMTNWLIGHTDRFKAAVTQRSVSNLISMYGSSDFNWYFETELGNIPPWEDMELYWKQSPMKYIGNTKTPTLVIHSEQDLRCAIEQGEQIFVALKRLGVPTEMVRFPDEPHGLSRTGRTDRRIVRLGHILRWFDNYLKPGN